jgi:hypothetical protein
LAAARALLAGMMMAACVGAASGQQSRPGVMVAASLAVAPTTKAPFPIQVGPPDAVTPGCFVRVRGLPPTAALSDGHSIAPGAWAVPIAALPSLKIAVPEGVAGHSEVVVTLVSADGRVLAEARLTLLVTPAPPKTAAMLRTDPPPQPAPEKRPAARPAGVPSLSSEARERTLRLVKKGDEQLAEGAIAQARLLYERAAEAGSALGAMALAATYDPAELQRLGALGLKPDREAAQRWYERARQLGAVEAEERLRRLGAN